MPSTKRFLPVMNPAPALICKASSFAPRLNSGKGNGVVPKQITADHRGRVYMVGSASAHLPIPPRVTVKEVQVAPNPTGLPYGGGAFILVMSADMSQRLYCTRAGVGTDLWGRCPCFAKEYGLHHSLGG